MERERILAQLRSYGRPFLLFWLLFSGIYVQAQDPVLSQFHLNKNYLNPAFAGYSRDLSFSLHSRFQWTRVPGYGFRTYTFATNIGYPRARLGMALTGYRHTEGEGFLTTTNIGPQISVNFPGRLGKFFGRKLHNKNFIFSGGMQFNFGQKYLDWSRLTFSDQYDAYEGYTGQASQINPVNQSSNILFDISSGARGQIEFGKKGSYISLGAAFFHLNRPVESFFTLDNKLNIRYTIHSFIYFQTKKYTNNPDYLSVGMVSDNQQSLRTNTLLVYKDLGTYFKTGLGFRRQNFIWLDRNVDAILLQGLFYLDNFTLGYSYDFTISDFGPHRSFGTHEIGIIYQVKDRYFGKRRSSKSKAEECFFLNTGNYTISKSNTWNP